MPVVRNRRRLTKHRRTSERIVRAIAEEYASERHSFPVHSTSGLRTSWMASSELTELASGRRLLDAPPDLQVPACVVAADQATGELPWTAHYRILEELDLGKLPFAREDVVLLLGFGASARDPHSRGRLLQLAMPAVESYVQARGVDGLERPLRRALARLDSGRDDADADRSRTRARLARLLAEAGAAPRLDESLLQDGDNWGRAVRTAIRRDFAGVDGLEELLAHLASATSGPRPSARWRKHCEELLARVERSDELIRLLLEEAAGVDDRSRFPLRGFTWVYLVDANAVLVRGAIWAAGVLGADWAPDVLGDLAERAAEAEHGEPRSLKVANAALRELGELEAESALERLSQLRTRIKHRTIVKQAETALATAAERAGISKAQLVERRVPTFGLDADGSREVPVGDSTAIVQVEGEKAQLRWRTAKGRDVKSVPKEVKERHDEELKELRAELKELRKALGAQRARLEGLFAEERSWPYEEWRGLYRDHPLLGGLTRRLIWRFDDEAALGEDAPEAETVRLWRPIDASAEEVAEWRSRIIEQELVQPFKQAFREVYHLAPAERETGTYSNRFAAHIVRYAQGYALMKARDWAVVALGPWDFGEEGGRSRREFEESRITAEFWMDYVEAGGDDLIASLASTDQVRFVRDGEPMPLEEVPPGVFSETMRDVDLFVSVSSIAGDPNWLDHGTERFNRYWYDTSFGELTETAETRREVLEQLVPQLKIADRCELTDKFLVVRGNRRTYKIHLGSANVLMGPNDQYLCIVAERGRGLRNLFLPFEEDPRLSEILSKAFLLAADDKIEDKTITRQIGR